jgi:hypothetical protein
VPETAPAAKTAERVQPIIIADLGADFLYRWFSVQGLETANLAPYEGKGIIMPAVHVEFYPLAFFLHGLAAGIGLTGDAAFAVGLTSKLPDGTSFPTRVTRFGAGLKWSIRPIQGSGFNFGPEVGFRAWDFELLPGAGGVTVSQVPLIAYRAIDAGLSVEVPLGSIGTISARGSYQPLLSAANLISSSIFPTGHGAGWNGELTLGFFVGLKQYLEVRLSGTFDQYNLTFTDVSPTAAFRATGSTDLYIGGRLSLRVRW